RPGLLLALTGDRAGEGTAGGPSAVPGVVRAAARPPGRFSKDGVSRPARPPAVCAPAAVADAGKRIGDAQRDGGLDAAPCGAGGSPEGSDDWEGAFRG